MDPDRTDFSRETFTRLTLASGHTRDASEYSECTFTNCTFREVAFKNCRFERCAFKDCDLSLATFHGVVFAETTFTASKLLGVNWTVTAWAGNRISPVKPVDFVACNLTYSVFIGMNLRKLHLTKCVAHDVRFEDANFTDADCRATDFTGANFARADLTRADFREAHGYAVSPLTNTIKGAKFSMPGALALLRGLDVEIDGL